MDINNNKILNCARLNIDVVLYGFVWERAGTWKLYIGLIVRDLKVDCFCLVTHVQLLLRLEFSRLSSLIFNENNLRSVLRVMRYEHEIFWHFLNISS